MKKIKKLLVYTFNIPLYLIAKIIPKDKNIWIFGAWFGEKYGDNSKYLFEYVNKNHPEIRAIWLTKNKETLNIIRKKGYKVYYSYSFMGYLYSLRACFSFISTGFNDINHFVFTKFYINLWHGIPLKKIVYDDKLVNSIRYDTLFHKLIRIIFPFIRKPEDFYKVIASSKDETITLSTAFRKNINNILATGLPRNDIFFQKKLQNKREMINVIYMPTHRNEGELDIKELFLNNIDLINNSLEKNSIILHIKLHYYHMKDMNQLKYTNIKLLFDDDIEQDIYSKINIFDILITDYSSIYFDYLLSDKPIIFAPFDYEEYIKRDRELYYDYGAVTPGPKCRNWNEVIQWIEKFKENPDLYSKERKKIRDKFHQYQDGKSCERVYDEMQRLLSE